MAEITTQEELEARLAALGEVSDDQKQQITCALVGHSRIRESCLGQITCGRCGAIVGDAVMGVYDARKDVLVGHDCEICRANAATLTFRDTFLAKDPFPSKEN